MVVPEGTLVQTVSKDIFTQYKEALQGLTEGNMPEVMAKLLNLGLQPGAGVMQRAPEYIAPADRMDVQRQGESATTNTREKRLKEVAVQMVGAMKETPGELASTWAKIVASAVEAMQPSEGAVFAAQDGGAPQVGAPAPDWAIGCVDKREALTWDASQVVAHCTVNNVLTYAVLDTGAYKTIMDVGMAKILGL